ncbi:hypothetical protein [Agrobacterium bohemicum]|uniref:hypothetical protein n=1 Tax=Agrobacterium bohemicum TaxID=2052828 RepID=UPI000A72367D|nr:hypothetical protein [Agrobacterium bohemicum]
MFSKIAELGLPVERIEATDGRKLTFPIPEFSELSYMLMHGRRNHGSSQKNMDITVLSSDQTEVTVIKPEASHPA